MKKLIVLGLLCIPTLLHADTSNLQFINGWMKQLPPVVPLRAGYLQIKNPDKQDHQIIALQSDAFERVEMHESRMQDGVMHMVELESLLLPAESRLELKPGGKHLMLVNPIQPLNIGDRFNVIVTFADESTISVQLEVRK